MLGALGGKQGAAGGVRKAMVGASRRLRSPQWPARTVAAAAVAVKPWPHINATYETVVFARAPPSLADMQEIVVTLST